MLYLCNKCCTCHLHSFVTRRCPGTSRMQSRVFIWRGPRENSLKYDHLNELHVSTLRSFTLHLRRPNSEGVKNDKSTQPQIPNLSTTTILSTQTQNLKVNMQFWNLNLFSSEHSARRRAWIKPPTTPNKSAVESKLWRNFWRVKQNAKIPRKSVSIVNVSFVPKS